jgi:hypothetical protein
MGSHSSRTLIVGLAIRMWITPHEVGNWLTVTVVDRAFQALDIVQ